jgi:hypothetical protein
MEFGSGEGRGKAIRNFCYSDRQLLPGHDPGADSGEVPNGRQGGSRPLDIWLSAAATLGRGEMSHRAEMVTTITCDSHPMSPSPPDERRGRAGSRLRRSGPSRRSRRSRRGRAGDGHGSHGPTVQA